MRKTLEFMMYQWLGIESLTARERYAAHSRETFDSVLDLSERMATEQFLPLNRLTDVEEPQFRDGEVVLPAGVNAAVAAFEASGLLAAGHDEAVGGMKL